MKFHHQRKQVSTCIILVLKEVKFLAFLALQRNYLCFTLKIINCNEFHSDLISLFEKLDKNIEIGNNEWHGAPFGEIETNQEISVMDKTSRIFGIFFSCWFFIFFSENSKCFHRNGFEMYILIIIYTVCPCDTLVPTRILNSEISWLVSISPNGAPCHSLLPISINKKKKCQKYDLFCP
jgi:hypothetical protein